MSGRRGVAVVLAGALVVAAAGAGCSSGDDDGAGGVPTTTTTTATTASTGADARTGSYVGTVDGTGAFVSVVVADGGRGMAYVTDGADSVDWLEGFVDDEGATLVNDGGAHMEITFDGSPGTGAGDTAPGELSGTFQRPGDQPGRFTVEAVEAPAGLYRAEQSFSDGLYIAGWVVLDDGSQRGSIRRYETPLPQGRDVPDLDLDRPDTLAVEVPGGVLHPIYVDPARL